MVPADRLGLAADRVTFVYGDSKLPGTVLAGGSQQTASIGAAVMAAHRALVVELLKLAGKESPLAGLAADEVESREGGLCHHGEPARLRGGIVMGLGLALMEETQFDERSGRIMNPSLAEYHVPAHLDVPEIEVMWTDIPDPHAPMGAHGVGEIGTTGTGAAVANAIYNATGKRLRDVPLTLDKLL